MVLFFWLIGYGVFFRYVVGRIMYGFIARDFLLRRSQHRANPLRILGLFCPSSVVGDFVYLEGFLFSVEFLILTFLVVTFFAPVVKTSKVEVFFKLTEEANLQPIKQLEIVNSMANVFRLFNRTRAKLFISNSSNDMNLLSLKILEQLFQPYNQQTWLVQVFESFFPLLQQIAYKELTNANLDS